MMDCFEGTDQATNPEALHVLGKTACNIQCLAADPVKNNPRPADPDREGRTRASYLKALGKKNTCIF